MSSAATGSLGALLMIAPLAAIPVFAIVGMPRFSSMVAASGEQEYYEIDSAAEAETPAQTKLKSSRDRDSGNGDEAGAGSGPSSATGERGTRGAGRRTASARDARRPTRSDRVRTGDAEEESGIEQFEPGLVWPKAQPEPAPAVGTERAESTTDLFSDPDAPAGSGRDGGQPEKERWVEIGRRIRDLGIRQHQLSPDTDASGRLRFVFTCLVAQAGEPTHRFSASGATAFEAIEAALDRVARTVERP